MCVNRFVTDESLEAKHSPSVHAQDADVYSLTSSSLGLYQGSLRCGNMAS